MDEKYYKNVSQDQINKLASDSNKFSNIMRDIYKIRTRDKKIETLLNNKSEDK